MRERGGEESGAEGSGDAIGQCNGWAWGVGARFVGEPE